MGLIFKALNTEPIIFLKLWIHLLFIAISVKLFFNLKLYFVPEELF